MLYYLFIDGACHDDRLISPALPLDDLLQSQDRDDENARITVEVYIVARKSDFVGHQVLETRRGYAR